MNNYILIGLLIGLSSPLMAKAAKTPPSCDSAIVRLSKKPIVCVPSMTDIDFDIPGAELDIEDLKKIFQGAESSGGRIINPMHVPREMTPIAPFPFKYNCELKVVLDGNKRVSYLSKQELELNEMRYFVRLDKSAWKHGLVLENTVDAPMVAELDIAPEFGLDHLRVEVKFNDDKRELSLNACNEGGSLNCATSALTKEGGEVTLYSEVSSGPLQAKRTFKVSCLSH